MLSRIVAAIVLAFLIGFLMHASEQSTLARLQSMSAQEVVEHERTLASHGYVHAVVLVAVIGVLYITLVETVAFVLRRGWRQGTAV